MLLSFSLWSKTHGVSVRLNSLTTLRKCSRITCLGVRFASFKSNNLQLNSYHNVKQVTSKLVRINPSHLDSIPNEFKNNSQHVLSSTHNFFMTESLIGGAWVFKQGINIDNLEANIEKSLLKYPWLASVIGELDSVNRATTLVHSNNGIKLTKAEYLINRDNKNSDTS